MHLVNVPAHCIVLSAKRNGRKEVTTRRRNTTTRRMMNTTTRTRTSSSRRRRNVVSTSLTKISNWIRRRTELEVRKWPPPKSRDKIP